MGPPPNMDQNGDPQNGMTPRPSSSCDFPVEILTVLLFQVHSLGGKKVLTPEIDALKLTFLCLRDSVRSRTSDSDTRSGASKMMVTSGRGAFLSAFCKALSPTVEKSQAVVEMVSCGVIKHTQSNELCLILQVSEWSFLRLQPTGIDHHGPRC